MRRRICHRLGSMKVPQDVIRGCGNGHRECHGGPKAGTVFFGLLTFCAGGLSHHGGLEKHAHVNLKRPQVMDGDMGFGPTLTCGRPVVVEVLHRSLP